MFRKFYLKTLMPLSLAAVLGFPCGAIGTAFAAQAGQATDAGNSKADVDLAAKIRRAVMDDKSLSVAAHNVEIIVKDGNVTIRGQVPSSDQRDSILEKARGIAGPENVVDAMVVNPPKS